MNKQKELMTQAQKLRSKAEKQLFPLDKTTTGELTKLEISKLIYELETHQIELEMQNDTLRQAQEELAIQRDQYADLYNHAPVGYVTLSKKGLILQTNKTFSTMLGISVEKLKGSSFAGHVNSDDQDAYYIYQRKCIASNIGYSSELHLSSLTGNIFWAHLTCSFIENSDNECRLVVSDISKHKKAEAELHKIQKLKGLGNLAGGIAHDLNNILMVLFGNISMAKMNLSKDSPVVKYLERSESSMDRAINLSKQLLSFAKGGEPIKETINLAKLIEKVTRFDLSGSNVQPTFESPKDLWLADIDAGQVQQVFSNLTINAKEAMPEGGHLIITLENTELKEWTKPYLKGKYIKVSVRDEGSGIDAKYLDEIFDPYFSTKPTGSGLGLATVYSIISKHDGHIGIDTELGKGTVFTLHLPAVELPKTEENSQPEMEISRLNRDAKILVMDDDEWILELTMDMLALNEFKTDTALDGAQAIEMYKQAFEINEPYDLIIMDLTIPGGIGGKEAIIDILKIDPNARAIVSSGYSNDPVMANYIDYGFKGCVAKPYIQKQLLDELFRVLQ